MAPSRLLLTPLLALAVLLGAGCFEKKADHGEASNGWRGHWLVINYWAEWCGPCHAEIPELNALQERLKGSGVRLLGISFDGLQGQALEKARRAMGIAFPVPPNDPAASLQLPRPEGLPMTYLIDPQGQLREQLPGAQTAAGLEARLQKLGALQGNRE